MNPVTSNHINPRAAYQGEPGAFGEAAVIAHWRGHARPMPASTFRGAIALVCADHADFAAIPVWNSSVGPIGEGLQALAEYDASVELIGAIVIPVRLCLLGLTGATMDSVRTVASHRAALGQCSRFFAEHRGLTPLVADNTARAAYELSWLSQPRDGSSRTPWYAGLSIADPRTLGVIASVRAAEHYGLTTLAEGIQDDPDNRTRFVICRVRIVAAGGDKVVSHG
jgi:prephenate dehydratase